MHIACLDTESTSTGISNEILELSIYNEQGALIHNQLYKPKKVHRWHFAERVHGISPEMVADKPYFAKHIPKIQKIFDKSEIILGFAVDNDIRVLEKYGFQHLTEKAMDVRDLYWAVFHEEKDFDYYHVPRLVVCAEECGYTWRDGSAHSAAADAEATLFCFNYLIRKYVEKYNLFELQDKPHLSTEEINIVWDHLRHLLREERHNKAVEKAKGLLYLVDTPQGYAVYARKRPLTEEDTARFQEKQRKVISIIELADSQKGYEDLLSRFAPKMIGGENYYKAFYQLDDQDIELFKNYTNEFIDEAYLKE